LGRKSLDSEQIDLIEILYETGYTPYQIARQIELTNGVVKSALIASGHDVKLHPSITLSEEQNIVILYREGASLETLHKQFPYSPTVVSQVLQKHGVDRRPFHGKRIYNLNHSAFSELTPESLYYGGWVLTDGNVYYPDRGQASIQLGIADRDVVENFQAFLGTKQPITTRQRRKAHHKELYNLFVQSNQLASDLQKYFGVVPKKSLVIKVPDEYKEQVLYSRFFLAGILEGDGSYWYKITDGRLYPTVEYTSGSYDMICQYRESLDYNGFDVAWKKIKVNKRTGVYQFCIVGEKAISFLKWLYADSSLPYMRRKYQLAQEMIERKYRYGHELRNKEAILV
jgi:hypothetical protein